MKADEVIPHICNNIDPARCSKPDHPGACENCGKPIEEHPSVDVSNTDRFFLCQDRAMKWARVEPGTVIPAGQSSREERGEFNEPQDPARVLEYRGEPHEWTVDQFYDGSPHRSVMFIDSSWKPPLVLPTEPTWGIVIGPSGPDMSLWCHGDDEHFYDRDGGGYLHIKSVRDFIPLTDEQVARIEAAR